MIDEIHIRPDETLRCESRRPGRELGVLRWSLAATVVLAAALDAMWLVPARHAASRPGPMPHYDTPSYSEMQRQRCRKHVVARELAAARVRVRTLEAEARALEEAEIDALADADTRSVEVMLVRAPR